MQKLTSLKLEEEAQWEKTRALMEVGYLPFCIWTFSLEYGIYFLISCRISAAGVAERG